MEIVVCVAVEAVLECCGRIAQFAFAHDRELFQVQIPERFIANLVGNLEPKRSVAGWLPVAEFSDGIFNRVAHRIEIAAKGFHAPCGEIGALLAYACARA